MLVLAFAGCAAAAPAPAPDEGPAFPGVPPSRDLRADFRAATCALPGASKATCDAHLRREAGEADRPRLAPDPSVASRFRVGLVPGLLAECLAPRLKPFGDVEAPLAARGFAVTYFAVPGRGSARANARFLAERIAAAPPDPRPWILVAYSKGVVDSLELLASEPAAAGRVAAIVSVSGAAGGSPLADTLADAYRQFVADLDLAGCATGDGQEVRDLSRAERRDWWRRHGESIRVPVLSLVATASPDRVSMGSRLTYRRLSAIDPRNDGKILWRDQLVPGGYLLGFLDADHWTAAVPLARDLPAFAFLFKDDIPRARLVEAAVGLAAALVPR